MSFIDDFKECSGTKQAIAIIAVCCVGLIIIFAIVGMFSPDANTSTNQNTSSNDNNTLDLTEPEKYTDGTYKVGVDIIPGEYKFTQTSEYGGYIERASDSSMDTDSIISNDLTSEKGQSTYVTVNEGEYLKIQGGELTPV